MGEHRKQCTVCNQWQDIEEYRLLPSAKDKTGRIIDGTKRERRCKTCDKLRQKAKYNEKRREVVHIMGNTCSVCGYTHDNHEAFNIVGQLPATRNKPWRGQFRVIIDNPVNFGFYYKLVCNTCTRTIKKGDVNSSPVSIVEK